MVGGRSLLSIGPDMVPWNRCCAVGFLDVGVGEVLGLTMEQDGLQRAEEAFRNVQQRHVIQTRARGVANVRLTMRKSAVRESA
jgi:gamma-glutamylcysteine synthetase